jgi:hypothetical protein
MKLFSALHDLQSRKYVHKRLCTICKARNMSITAFAQFAKQEMRSNPPLHNLQGRKYVQNRLCTICKEGNTFKTAFARFAKQEICP